MQFDGKIIQGPTQLKDSRIGRRMILTIGQSTSDTLNIFLNGERRGRQLLARPLGAVPKALQPLRRSLF